MRVDGQQLADRPRLVGVATAGPLGYDVFFLRGEHRARVCHGESGLLRDEEDRVTEHAFEAELYRTARGWAVVLTQSRSASGAAAVVRVELFVGDDSGARWEAVEALGDELCGRSAVHRLTS